MNSIFFKWLKAKILNFNLFELGNSVILYYLLIFYLVPFLALIGFSIKFTLINYQIPWQALGYLTLGLGLLVIGYFGPLARYLAEKTPNIFIGSWNLKRVKIAFWTIFSLGIVAKIIRLIAGGYFIKYNLNPSFGQSAFYSLIGYLDWFGYIALVIALINYCHLKKIGNKDYRIWKLLAFSVLFIEIAYGIPSCSRVAVIVPILLYFLIKSHLFKIKYWEIAFIAAAIIFVLFPFGNICRNPSILSAYQVIKADINQIPAFNIPVSSISVSNTRDFLADSFLSRINQASVFSKILEVPRDVLASYGSSLSNFLMTLGPPRFIWKDKPLSTNSLGNDFGHQLGIISPEDFTTSVGPTIIGDFYINFGIPGIIFGMFLAGIVFRFIYNYLVKLTAVSSSGLLIYSIFWIQILQGMENWTAPVLAGLMKLFVILIIIHFFLIYKAGSKS